MHLHMLVWYLSVLIAYSAQLLTSLFIGQMYCSICIGDWNAKVESQETPGVTGKFGLGVQNGGGQRLMEFCYK